MSYGSGSLFKRKGKPFWLMQYYMGGRRFCESTGTGNKRKAGRKLARRVQEVEEGTFRPEARKLGFQRLVELIRADFAANERRSTDRLERCLKHLCDHFAGMQAVAIPPVAARYIAARRTAGAKSGTVRNELSALKRMFSLAHRAGLIAYRPAFPTVAPSAPRKGFLEPEQLAAILANLRPHLRPLVEFLSITGWRVSEGKALLWSRVDFGNGVVRIEPGESKTGEPRVFPFDVHPRLKALLTEQRERVSEIEKERSRIVPHVFVKPDGNPIINFHAAWQTARKNAGVPGAIVHDLRRGAARAMVNAGVGQPLAMKLLGHKTAAVFTRYAVAADEDLKAAVRKLAALPVAPGRTAQSQS